VQGDPDLVDLRRVFRHGSSSYWVITHT
jgi:hypothetical protein